MANSFARADVATEGNGVATSFQVDADTRRHARFWTDVVEGAHLQDKDLADLLGWSKGYYSKVASGQQGDLLGMVFQVGLQRPDLRRAFIAKLSDFEQLDPVAVAAEQAAIAAIRLVRACRASRMAKAAPRRLDVEVAS
jgi:hypothetical protein